MGEPHECFTVSSTAYLHHLDDEDRCAEAFAVHYQRPPKKTERGTSISLNFPLLLVTGYSAAPRDVADRVAAILNKHWDDPA